MTGFLKKLGSLYELSRVFRGEKLSNGPGEYARSRGSKNCLTHRVELFLEEEIRHFDNSVDGKFENWMRRGEPETPLNYIALWKTHFAGYWFVRKRRGAHFLIANKAGGSWGQEIRNWFRKCFGHIKVKTTSLKDQAISEYICFHGAVTRPLEELEYGMVRPSIFHVPVSGLLVKNYVTEFWV